MDEDQFNLEIRKFLKKVGITSQREIEKAVRDAIEQGSLKGNESLRAVIRLEIPELGLTHLVEDEIALK